MKLILMMLLLVLPVWSVFAASASIENLLATVLPTKDQPIKVNDEVIVLQKEKSRLARQVWASNNNVDFSTLFSKDYINHQIPSIVGKPLTESRQVWQNLVAHFHQSFSDVEEKVLFQITENEFVATQWQTTGTQTGEYLDYAATGKRVSWSGIQIDRFYQGKIVESWVVWDMYSLFSQLGFIPFMGNK